MSPGFPLTAFLPDPRARRTGSETSLQGEGRRLGTRSERLWQKAIFFWRKNLGFAKAGRRKKEPRQVSPVLSPGGSFHERKG